MNRETGVRNRRPPEGEEDGFMVSYSALMILLLTFMILMVTLANFKEPRFRKAIGSVRGAFSFLPYAGGDDLMSQGSHGFLTEEVLARADSVDAEDEAYKQAVEAIKDKAAKPEFSGLEIEQRPGGLAIKVSDELMFDRGEAELKPEISPVLDLIARAVNLRPGKVSVVGNTCDLPIATSDFASNWELSIIRAVNVVHHLESRGVSPESLFAYGLADQVPINPNADEQSRRRNRRVDIYVANRVGSVDGSSEVRQ